jgi:hypothetical protein
MASGQTFRPGGRPSRARLVAGRLGGWQPGRSDTCRRRGAFATALAVLALVALGPACSPQAPAPPAASASASAPPAAASSGVALAPAVASAGGEPPAAAEGAAGAGGAADDLVAGGFEAPAVARFLFAEGEAERRLAACRGAAGGEPLCLIEAAYGGDREAFELARALYERTGSVAGVEDAQTIDGGYRGPVRLVPELPKGPHRRHLAWAVAAFDEFDRFLDALGGRPGEKARFFAGPVALRYYRSVGKRTPNAYAAGRQIAYNVNGSINRDAGEVRDTLFHELFHLNDERRGGWSRRELGALYDGIVARCGTDAACLAPYAPNKTKVRGGTYYAFQPGNGVAEYAAELAVRYLREQREASAGRAAVRAFKCGPPESARAWAAFAGEFFAGFDRTGPCP